MKPFFVFLTLFAFASMPVANGQNNPDKNKRIYTVGNFDKILLEGNYRVFLSHAEKSFLKIEAPSDDMYDAIKVDSDNGALQLSIKKTRFYLNRIDLYIGSPTIRELEVSGDIKVTTDGYLDVNDLSMLVQGGANVDMSLKAKSIDVRCEGAVLLEMRGVSDNLSVKISGAGHVNARELTSKEVTIRVEGVGFGSVYATNLLDVKIEGVGKVTYKGNPEIKRIISGLGKVEQY